MQSFIRFKKEVQGIIIKEETLDEFFEIIKEIYQLPNNYNFEMLKKQFTEIGFLKLKIREDVVIFKKGDVFIKHIEDNEDRTYYELVKKERFEMDLKDIREWDKLKKDLPDLEILYYENEFYEDKKNVIEYTDYEKYERDSLKTFLTSDMEDEKKYIIHKVLGDLGEEELEKFIENKKENIEDNLKIDLEYLNEKLEHIEEKEEKKVIKSEKEIEDKENTKEIELI